jgi:5-methylcytosine-specific restriction endonuclease McrA
MDYCLKYNKCLGKEAFNGKPPKSKPNSVNNTQSEQALARIEERNAAINGIRPKLSAARKLREKDAFIARLNNSACLQGMESNHVSGKALAIGWRADNGFNPDYGKQPKPKPKTNKSICWLCGVVITHHLEVSKDHVIPKSKGGTDRKANILPAHVLCNNMRSSLMPYEEKFKAKFPRAQVERIKVTLTI